MALLPLIFLEGFMYTKDGRACCSECGYELVPLEDNTYRCRNCPSLEYRYLGILIPVRK